MSRRGWLNVPVGPRGSIARLPLGPTFLADVERSNRTLHASAHVPAESPSLGVALWAIGGTVVFPFVLHVVLTVLR